MATMGPSENRRGCNTFELSFAYAPRLDSPSTTLGRPLVSSDVNGAGRSALGGTPRDSALTGRVAAGLRHSSCQRRFSALGPPSCRPDSERIHKLLSVCRDSDRPQLWPYLCARRLVGHRRIDLERSRVTCSGDGQLPPQPSCVRGYPLPVVFSVRSSAALREKLACLQLAAAQHFPRRVGLRLKVMKGEVDDEGFTSSRRDQLFGNRIRSRCAAQGRQ